MAKEPIQLTVSDFLALTNQILDGAFPSVIIEGEVSSFKVNQNKYVFFDLKDAEGTVGCFMMAWQLRVPIEDGMTIRVVASPKLTNWGKFSLTVRDIRPVGEGSIKKSFELLKAKLEKEGLFDDARKRTLPRIPRKVAVISSTGAAGYTDFITILNQRWGGLDVEVAQVQVQGEVAPGQIMRAIKCFNERSEPAEVLVIVRGGGSVDDLAVFNDEELVRSIASSRIPTLAGIGHEVDITLADLAADLRAATPTNAAQLLVPDRKELINEMHYRLSATADSAARSIDEWREQIRNQFSRAIEVSEATFSRLDQTLEQSRSIIKAYNPQAVLERGYAILRGEIAAGELINIETRNQLIKAEVKDVKRK